MQFHLISRPPGEPIPEYEPLSGMSVGSLPRHEVQVLAALLSRHTTRSDSCWFAVWEGYGQLQGPPASGALARSGRRAAAMGGIAPPEVLHGPRLELRHRSYLLLHGAVADAAGAFELLGRQSPNLWWPEDRAWCVATEIDFGWTYVAGSELVITEVLIRPNLRHLRPGPLTVSPTAATASMLHSSGESLNDHHSPLRRHCSRTPGRCDAPVASSRVSEVRCSARHGQPAQLPGALPGASLVPLSRALQRHHFGARGARC
jgi:hypothetical protein